MRSRLEHAAASIEGVLLYKPVLLLSLCIVLCCATFIGYSHAKFPWEDEVLEITVARLSSGGEVWNAARSGLIQMDPPILHVAIHYLFRVFGESVLLARLPAILGFSLLCAAVACLVWKHSSPLYGAAAFFLPYSTVLRGRAMDARPYGLMFGFSALTILCWDRAASDERKTVWRIALFLSLAATFSTHFYSILILLPLAFGELVKWRWTRRLDWASLGCIAAACGVYAVWLPTLRAAAARYMKTHHYQVSFQNFADFYSNTIASLPLANLFVLLLLVGAAAVYDRGVISGLEQAARSTAKDMEMRTAALLAICAGFILIPAAGFAAGVTVTKLFIPYHYIFAAIGFIVGFPLLLNTISGSNRTVALCLLAVVLAQGGMVTVRGLSGFFRAMEIPYPTLAELSKLAPEPHPEFVVASPLHFMVFYERNRAVAGDQLIFLYDAKKALREVGTDSGDLLHESLRAVTPARIEPFEPYIAKHRHFNLAVMGEVKGVLEWQYTYLMKQPGVRMRWLGKAGEFNVFSVDVESYNP